MSEDTMMDTSYPLERPDIKACVMRSLLVCVDPFSLHSKGGDLSLLYLITLHAVIPFKADNGAMSILDRISG